MFPRRTDIQVKLLEACECCSWKHCFARGCSPHHRLHCRTCRQWLRIGSVAHHVPLRTGSEQLHAPGNITDHGTACRQISVSNAFTLFLGAKGRQKNLAYGTPGNYISHLIVVTTRRGGENACQFLRSGWVGLDVAVLRIRRDPATLSAASP